MLHIPTGFYQVEGGGESSPLWNPNDLARVPICWLRAQDTDLMELAEDETEVDVWGDTSERYNRFDGYGTGGPTTGTTSLNSLNTLEFEFQQYFSKADPIINVRAFLVTTGQLYGCEGASAYPDIATFIGGLDNTADLSIRGGSYGTGFYLDQYSGRVSFNGETPVSGTGHCVLGLTTAEMMAPNVWYIELDTAYTMKEVGKNSYADLLGSLAEVIAFDYVPTDSEIERLFGYANWRYNLQSKLPATNAYKNEAPTSTPLPTNMWTPQDLSVDPKAWWSGQLSSQGYYSATGELATWQDVNGNGNDLNETGFIADRPKIYKTFRSGQRTVLFEADATSVTTEITGVKAAFFILLGTTGSTAAVPNTDLAPIMSSTDLAEYVHIYQNVLSIDGASGSTGAACQNGNSLVAGTNIDLGLTHEEMFMDNAFFVQWDGTIDIGIVGKINTYFLSGTIAEVILFDYLPTSTEIDKLFGWGCHTYSCTYQMPAGHTYKTTPPLI